MSTKLISLIRVLGAALGGLLGLTLATSAQLFAALGSAEFFVAAWILAWVVVGFTLLPYLTVVPADRLVRAVQGLSTDEFVAAVIGLVVGLVIGALLGLPMAAFPPPVGGWLPLATSAILGLGTMGLTVAKRHDLAAAAESVGLIRRPEGEGRSSPGPQIVVDTSAIIDGRIAEIAESGFVYGTLVVPRFVLDELQLLADSSDDLKRARGRRGLEMLARMQRESRTPVRVVEDGASGGDVDAKLVALAKARHGLILTNDLNLNRVAELQGLRVMNINSLANAVKPALVPGEDLRIRVIQEGKEPNQGVGYLDDGTMIVVEDGRRFVDREVVVTVNRVLQTVAGRMIFAQPHDGR
ncbi:MAG: hypothetical protein RL338_1775 [Chloroflexota bacterium]